MPYPFGTRELLQAELCPGLQRGLFLQGEGFLAALAGDSRCLCPWQRFLHPNRCSGILLAAGADKRAQADIQNLNSSRSLREPLKDAEAFQKPRGWAGQPRRGPH